MAGKTRRKFPDPWYSVRNQFSLKEYWYQQYVKAYPEEFGLSELEGPFDVGADFRGIWNGRSVTVEVEKDYLSYAQHGHPIFDVLIVGVLEEPHSDIVKGLPPVIINLDPQKVVDWSEPQRRQYWENKEKNRENLQKRLAFVDEEMKLGESSLIRSVRLQNERLHIELKDQRRCDCGGIMLESRYDPEDDIQLTDGQFADYEAGFQSPFECLVCGERGWDERY